MDLKNIVKGKAVLNCIKSGGVAVYDLFAEDGKRYMVEIDLSDKHDVGETATFQVEYEKSLTLMRWIRRAIENNTLIEL